MSTRPTPDIPFDLPENLALLAGAGAGKTHALITLALHLLAGARRDLEPLPPSRLVALTFTEKAAAEMKVRLRARVAALARGGKLEELEPDLFATFERLGLRTPKPAFFQALLESLSQAFVGTYHAFCAKLLRRGPASGPEFRLLEEREGGERLRDATRSLLLEALDSAGERAEQAKRIIRAHGYGLDATIEALVRIHQKLAEEGREAESLGRELPDEVALALQVDAARDSLRHHLEAYRVYEGDARLAEDFGAFHALAVAMLRDRVPHAEMRAAKVRLRHHRGPKESKPYRDNIKEALATLWEADVEAHALPVTQAFIALLGELQARFAAEKARDEVLDFADLLGHTRARLRDDHAFRSEIHAEIGALLVDEFQDTNPLQLEIVALLCERRAAGPRAVSLEASALETLPLEPRMLVAVGDRKQSIYEFRGAEVSLFERLRTHLEQTRSGRAAALRSNWRSRPELVRFFNALFAQVFAPTLDGQPFQVSYRPEDDLEPRRADALGSTAAELLALGEVDGEDGEALREREARAVVARIAELLGPDAPACVVGRDGQERRPRGGDVAILLRRFTHLEVFRRALIARGIPFIVVQGRGFYGAQEVRDLAQLLRTLDEPDDALAWAAVLRSPMVGLTDASLLRVALGPGRLAAVGQPGWTMPEGLEPFEQEALARYLKLFHRLVTQADRLRPSGCLAEAIDALELRAVLAAGFQGEQQVANLDKLVAWARRREERGAVTPGELALELLSLAEGDPREGQAAALEEGDPRAVRILTVHQSKGLEFPIVFVPECGAGLNRPGDRIAYDRALGLAARPRYPIDDARPAAHRGVTQVLRERAEAESLRLLYVAATRARDRLIFSGEAGRGPSWRAALDAFLASHPDAATLLVRREVPPALPFVRPAPAPRPPPSAHERAHAEDQVARLLAPPPHAVGELHLSVSELVEADLCPRRHHWRFGLGLPEVGGWRALPPPAEDDPRFSGAEPLTSGRLAHAVLARIDWAKARTGGNELLEGAFLEEGQAIHGGSRELLAELRTFLGGPVAARIARVPASRLYRALPYVLGLPLEGATLQLHGTLDVLALESGTALLLDIRTGRSEGRGAEPYALALDAAALAAGELLGEGVELWPAMAFLGDRDGQVHYRRPADPASTRERLIAAAEQVRAAQQAQRWPGLEEPVCQASGCGYRYRCHAASAPQKAIKSGAA